MQVDPAEAPLKLLGLDCSQVTVQTGMCPLWLAAGIVHPKCCLALAASCSWAMSLGAGDACSIAISDAIILLSFSTQAEGKAVLITGCDKGFGHALAKLLHTKGFTVFAGCLLAVSSNTDQKSCLIGEKMLLK